MAHPLNPEEISLLQQLWQRRSTLRGKELETLCVLIFQVLRQYSCPELGALQGGESRRTVQEHYINDFLVAKVLDVERFSDSPLVSVGALVGYFRNYLRNALEFEKRRRMDSFEEQQTGDQDSEALLPIESDCCGECQCSNASGHDQFLQSARQLIQSMEKKYLFLLHSYCADEPVFASAKRHNIASAAHHAGRLGIVKKQAGGIPDDYAKTMIGHWMKNHLSLEFVPDRQEEILLAMDALCAAAYEAHAENA